jgi:SH3-like domain-containing protein
MRPFLAVAVAIALCFALPAAPAGAAEALEEGPSGLPLPRFVSLGAPRVNVRMGPSMRHKIKWTFVKEGLPVEVVSEFGNWRRVRDAEGEEGWILGSLLSGRRTALVSPWSADELVPMRTEPDDDARPLALLEPMVLIDLDACDGRWCTVEVDRWRGAVEQRFLWGVYPSERVD